MMRGTLLVIKPKSSQPDVCRFDRPVRLEELQAAVGGYVELVPQFQTIAYFGTIMTCIALCNEHGKLDHLPLNESATMAWGHALRRVGIELADGKSGVPRDWLVGNVAVLFGDREFMGKTLDAEEE